MNGIYATAYHPPNLQILQRYNVNRGMAGLGNGEFLEREAEYQAIEQKRAAEWQALTPEEQQAKLAADVIIKAAIKAGESARLIMNSQAPIARLPLPAYQNKMRVAILAADFDAFNKLLVISKFGWSANTPLGMYRFKLINGKRIYVPFSDVDLARLFQYMSLAVNTYGYNRFAEPGATCDWQHLLDLYVNRQDAAKKQYPNTDWRHVVEIYPGRYICQVYRPSTWVKIRKPVVAAVLIVAAIYLGPIVMAKIGEAGAAEAAGAAAATTAEAGTAITAVAIETATVASTVTTVASTAGVVTTAAEAGSLFKTAQSVVGWVNKARTVDAIIKGELPPPPISISGGSFTEWAYDLAKEEVIAEAKQRAMELGQEYMQKDLSKAEEARIRAEIETMQRELAALLPPGTPIMPSPELAADVRQKIAAMQEIERQRQQQNIVLMALAAGGAFLAFG